MTTPPLLASSTQEPRNRGHARRGWAGALTILGTLLLGIAVTALVSWAGGAIDARTLPGLTNPGPLTPWALPMVRTVSDLAAAMTVGCLLATAFFVPGKDDAGKEGDSRRTVSPYGYRWLRTASWAAGVWTVAAIATLVFTLSDVLGVTPAGALTPARLASFAFSIPEGRAFLLVAVGALALAVVSRIVLSTTAAAVLACVAVVVALPPVFAGHAAAAGNHQIAVSTLVLHVAAALVWIGGLIALVLGRRLPVEVLARGAHRYSSAALWCFGLVAASGVGNAWVRLRSVSAVLTTSYGHLVLLKSLALVTLGLFGLAHRTRVLPALGAGRRGAFTRLAGVEVAVMAATVGIAVGLSRTPIAGVEPTTDRASALLGFPMPGPISASAVLTHWMIEPLFATAAVVATGLYLAGVRRLRRRGDAWSPARTAAWMAGWLVVVVTTSSGLARYGPVLFSVHMVQHMSLTMLAPVLLVLGGPITLALRALRPAGEPGLRGPREWLLTIVHSGPSRLLTHPLVALFIYVTSLYVMYFSGLYEAALRGHLWHLLMFAHFLFAGSLFFWILIGVDPAPRVLPYPVRIPLLFVSMVFHAFFGVAIMQSGTVIASSWYDTLARTWGTSPLADQRAGGGIAWAFGEIPSLLVLGALFFQWARSDEREQRRADRADDRAHERRAAAVTSDTDPAWMDDALSAYNRQLRALAERDAAQERAERARAAGRRRR